MLRQRLRGLNFHLLSFRVTTPYRLDFIRVEDEPLDIDGREDILETYYPLSLIKEFIPYVFLLKS
jgi:hypothetical protein